MINILKKIKNNRITKAYRLRKKGYITRFPKYISLLSEIEKPVYVNGLASISSKVKIGKYTYFQGAVRVSPYVEIGRFCSIAGGVNIAPTDHPINWLTTSPIAYEPGWSDFDIKILKMDPNDIRKTIIGNDVWIGIHSIIKRGVKIGDGAVIGSGSIVTKDVPPYAIVAGVPAKLIRYRFDEEIIKKLLELKWWNFNEKHLQEMPWDNVQNSIDYIEKIKNEIDYCTK